MKILTHLDDLPDARRLFIYGTGRTGVLLQGILSGADIHHIAGYIDSQSTEEVNHLPCYKPGDFVTFAQPYDIVLIASAYYLEIAARLDALGYSNYYNATFVTGLYSVSESTNQRKFIDRFLPPAAIVFDVGANQGVFTAYCARKAAKIVAFEPNPDTFAALVANTETLLNVEPNPLAMSDRSGQASLSVNTSQHYSYFSSLEHKSDSSVNVEVTTIDAFCVARDLVPSFIKIDAEGHDASVLRGARQTIERHRPTIFVESALDAEIVRELNRHYRLIRIPNTTERDYLDDQRPVTELDHSGSCNIGCIPL